MCIKWEVTRGDDPFFADQSDLVDASRNLKKLVDVVGHLPEGVLSNGGKVLAQDIARAMCEVCPVRIKCLEEAIEEEGGAHPHRRTGIRGGLNPNQRYRVYSRRTHNRE